MSKKKIMGLFTLLKKTSFLFLLISAAVFSTSFAGRLFVSSVNNNPAEMKELATTPEELESLEQLRSHGEVSDIHERLLRVKTNDYGRYDPAPALKKPPFKLIPN